ncbi:MAG: hypothetical protein ACI35S_08090 [Anaeroplasma sp.]
MNQIKISKGIQEIKIRGKGEVRKAIIEFSFIDFTIYVFKGSLSQFDILIKYKEGEKKIRTPKHIHWVVDILLKQGKEKSLTNEFLLLLQACWKECKPLDNNDYFTIKDFIETQLEKFDYDKYSMLNEFGEYPVDFLFVLMNLLSIQEKTNRVDAYMFGSIIDELLEDELDIFSIVSTAGFRGV